jgi:hypothetical protein
MNKHMKLLWLCGVRFELEEKALWGGGQKRVPMQHGRG